MIVITPPLPTLSRAKQLLNVTLLITTSILLQRYGSHDCNFYYEQTIKKKLNKLLTKEYHYNIVLNILLPTSMHQ